MKLGRPVCRVGGGVCALPRGPRIQPAHRPFTPGPICSLCWSLDTPWGDVARGALSAACEAGYEGGRRRPRAPARAPALRRFLAISVPLCENTYPLCKGQA
ncbi:hypothetical protein GCM10014713_37650 [Streptomyces purpureus]|uniref:Uncharacterized protein n=1 Tax=Streptomyces purpureus TaxID=1951 RepID=A0A918H695_9ACTN|nr:hypothetical protein GCM10014713_37650 [Streptomyces purpureus]